MTDLRTRFRTLDTLSAPNLWYDIEERAMAIQPTTRRSPWVLVAVMLLLALAIGGAALVGSGIIKLPLPAPDASPNPSASSDQTATPSASSTPVVQVPASWTATGSMIEARSGQTATLLSDGRVLVAGGVGTQISESGANILASAELYDPASGQWTATGAMAGVRVGHTATLLSDGTVLVAGGSACSDVDGCPVASAELYDPNTGTWTTTGSTFGAGTGRTATLLGDGTVLVVGGSSGSMSDGTLAPMRFAELYDPSSGLWTETGNIVEDRSAHTATLLLDGTVLVVGAGTAELYDASSGEWTATGAMLEGRVGHTATLLSDGTVLVAGSMAGTGASPSAELYDPSTGQWTATGAMIEGRIYHMATLLSDGTVLVAGGTNSVIDGGVASASAELYDPATGFWTATVSMPVARGGYTATLLRDGTVLVAGGADAGAALASAELYDPGSGS